MSSEFDDIKFNKRINEAGLGWIFNKKNNYTKIILGSITSRIQRNSNIIVVFFGDPGEGKSEGAQSLTKYWIIEYKRIKGAYSRVFLAFSVGDFDEILPEMKNGAIAIRDESSQLQGEGAYNLKGQLDNIAKLVRGAQNSFIFVSPECIKTKVVNYYLETAGRNFEKRATRFIVYDGEMNPMGYCILKLHDSDMFRAIYEQKKYENIDFLKAHSGVVEGTKNFEKIEREAKILMNFIEENYPNVKLSERKIKAIRTEYNSIMKKNNEFTKMIIGSMAYIKEVITKVLMNFELQNLKREKENNDSVESTLIVPELLNSDVTFTQFVSEYYKDPLIQKIAVGICSGLSYGEIVRDKKGPKVLQRQMNEIGGKLRSESPDGLWYLFEIYAALYIYHIPYNEIREVCRGAEKNPDGTNKPDIYDKERGVLATVKWRCNSKIKSDTFNQTKNFNPEYTLAKQLGRSYDFIYLNSAWYEDIHKLNLDPNSSLEVKILKNNRA